MLLTSSFVGDVYSRESSNLDEVNILCLELKARALLFTDKIQEVLKNSVYHQIEPFKIRDLEREVSNPKPGQIIFPQMRCNDEESKSVLLRLRLYTWMKLNKGRIKPTKEEFLNENITPYREEVEKALEAIGQDGHGEEEEGNQNLGTLKKSYKRYWLEFDDMWSNVKKLFPIRGSNVDGE